MITTPDNLTLVNWRKETKFFMARYLQKLSLHTKLIFGVSKTRFLVVNISIYQSQDNSDRIID
jgi:hypothetical protein